MAATLLWGRFLFGVELSVEHPLLFVLAVPATIASIGTLGFLLAVAFVRYRTAWAMGAVLEYPVWLVCGFLIPLTLFPGWVRPISWALAPTWGMNAIREASLGGSPLPDLLVCLALGAAYTILGVLVLESVIRAARASATLSLA
jgi:ABC-2 type transport system permease protein